MFELHSEIDKIINNDVNIGFAPLKCTADEDSDINPHDFDGTDVEYGTHRNIGQHSFSQMQVMCNRTIEKIALASRKKCG